MIRRRSVSPFLHRLRLAQVAAAVLLPVAALGQEFELRSTVPADPPSPAACVGKAALYTTGKVQVWVTRIGSMREDNPLRPLSEDRVIVLQVNVAGRVGTAFGRDFENLREGGGPAKLEEESSHPIVWEAGLERLPRAFRVVRENGSVQLGPLQFQNCGDAPAAAQAKSNQAKPRSGTPTRGQTAPANRPGLPQGAIQ